MPEGGIYARPTSTIAAVVMETTGTISVLHGDGPLDPDVLCGVADADQID